MLLYTFNIYLSQNAMSLPSGIAIKSNDLSLVSDSVLSQF